MLRDPAPAAPRQPVPLRADLLWLVPLRLIRLQLVRLQLVPLQVVPLPPSGLRLVPLRPVRGR